jgi:hypothetical protein
MLITINLRLRKGNQGRASGSRGMAGGTVRIYMSTSRARDSNAVTVPTTFRISIHCVVRTRVAFFMRVSCITVHEIAAAHEDEY